MKRQNLVQVWACTPITSNQDGEIQTVYTNPVAFYASIQSDKNASDAAVYGETLDQIIKLRTDTVPDVKISDALYLTKPEPKATIEVSGLPYEDYGEGDFLVKSITPAVIGARLVRNPTTITGRIVTKEV